MNVYELFNTAFYNSEKLPDDITRKQEPFSWFSDIGKK